MNLAVPVNVSVSPRSVPSVHNTYPSCWRSPNVKRALKLSANGASSANEAIHQAVGTAARANRAAKLIAGIVRREQDRTDRVATEQRTLRPAKHLHGRNIAQRHRAAHGIADVNIVDIKTHTWVDHGCWIGLTDTADENLRRGIVAGTVVVTALHDTSKPAAALLWMLITLPQCDHTRALHRASMVS